MFSKACEYAIKAMIFITVRSRHSLRTGLVDVVDGTGSPESFTAKILQKLVKSKLLESQKGPSGGFVINQKRASEISVSDIVKAIDGDNVYNGCALGFSECNELKPCPIHHQYKSIRSDISHMLKETTLENLSKDIDQGLTYLRRE